MMPLPFDPEPRLEDDAFAFFAAAPFLPAEDFACEPVFVDLDAAEDLTPDDADLPLDPAPEDADDLADLPVDEPGLEDVEDLFPADPDFADVEPLPPEVLPAVDDLLELAPLLDEPPDERPVEDFDEDPDFEFDDFAAVDFADPDRDGPDFELVDFADPVFEPEDFVAVGMFIPPGYRISFRKYVVSFCKRYAAYAKPLLCHAPNKRSR